MLCGTDPFPTDFRAKKYKLDKHSITKVKFILCEYWNTILLCFQSDFVHIMKNLPVFVSDEDIEDMFSFADKDGDGKLSYAEFKIMIDPPQPPEVPKPHITDLGLQPQVFSPDDPGPESILASPLLASSRVSSFFGSTTSISTHQSQARRGAGGKGSSVTGSQPNMSQTHL